MARGYGLVSRARTKRRVARVLGELREDFEGGSVKGVGPRL